MFKKKFFPKYFLLLLSTVTFVACDSGFIELETADVVENEGKENEKYYCEIPK